MTDTSTGANHIDTTTRPDPVASTAGSMLAAARRASGFSVEHVAGKLKLSKRQIEALEADRYQELPANTFVRGFVRNYARLVELDARPLLTYLDRHLPTEAPQAALPRLSDDTMPLMRLGGRQKRYKVFKVLLVLVVVFAAIVYGLIWQGVFDAKRFLPANTTDVAKTESPIEAIERGPELVAQPVPAAVVVAEPPSAILPSVTPVLTAPVATSATAPPTIATPTPISPQAAEPALADALQINTRGDSWMTVVDSTGKRWVNELVKSGESRVIHGKPPLKLTIGNAKYVDVIYKGKVTDLVPHTKVAVANLVLN